MKLNPLYLSVFLALPVAKADILTSIKPIGFIASAIADGVTPTQVLLPDTASPHDYSLKISDISKLKKAELVIWIDPDMENFLTKTIKSLPKNKVLTLGNIKEIQEIVKHSHHEHHDIDDDDDDHDHSEHGHDHHQEDHAHEHHHDHEDGEHEHHHHHDKNFHIWMSVDASTHIAKAIADKLTALYPQQKDRIAQNLANFAQGVEMKTQNIKKQLSFVKNLGYFTFHDAYGYFEDEFGLNSQGSFTINPIVAPGVKTLTKIKNSIKEKKAVCLFTEPQFTPKVVQNLQKNTSARISSLDPLGAKIKLGKTSYEKYLQSLSDSFYSCLIKSK